MTADHNRAHRGTNSTLKPRRPCQECSILILSFQCFSFTFSTCSGLCLYLVLLLSLISLQKHLINLTHYTYSHSFSHTGFIAQLMTCKWLNHTLLNKCQLHFFTMCMCVGTGRGVCVKCHRAREGVRECVCVLFINLIKAVI